jgi:hypothetical protein
MFFADVFLRFFGIQPQESEYREDSQDELIDFVLEAQESLKVVSGEGRAYTNQQVLELISTLSGADDGSVEFVVGPSFRRASIDLLLDAGAKVYILNRELAQHLAIIDEQRARIEAPHSLSSGRRRQYFVRKSATKAELITIFNGLKAHATEIKS